MHSSNLNSPINLGDGELALARQLTYELLGQLFLEGVTAVTLPKIQLIPSLAKTIATPFNADEAAATYQSLFGFNVFPYESIFLDDSGLLGGAMTEAVIRSYQEAGFQIEGNQSSPDHIGHELHLLAHLCGAEADAWEDNLTAVAQRMRDLQITFLQNHLLRWLVPLVMAVASQKRPFFTALAELMAAFIQNHYEAISSPDEINDRESFTLTLGAQLNLVSEKTGLKDIAEFLVTPPRSGIYLSWDDVVQLARQQELPRGFGDRTQMLTNLMRSAAQYNLVPALMTGLEEIVEKWVEGYGRYATHFVPFTNEWQTRAAQTRQLLHQINQQIQNLK